MQSHCKGSELMYIPIVGFDFASLPQSSVIVDVGGGVGTVARLLTTKFDNVNVIVQDREEVVEEGIKVIICVLYPIQFSADGFRQRWKETSPELLENGRVTFKGKLLTNCLMGATYDYVHSSVLLFSSTPVGWSQTGCVSPKVYPT